MKWKQFKLSGLSWSALSVQETTKKALQKMQAENKGKRVLNVQADVWLAQVWHSENM